MDIKAFVESWLAASNDYDTESYLSKYHQDAILDDPSVGRTFEGHDGIKRYFDAYFIGYKTQTRLVKLEIKDENFVHVEVEFTGDFPEGQIGGMFDLQFKSGLIIAAKADLM